LNQETKPKYNHEHRIHEIKFYIVLCWQLKVMGKGVERVMSFNCWWKQLTQHMVLVGFGSHLSILEDGPLLLQPLDIFKGAI